MALTGEQLVDEVKDIVGRPDDAVLITDARVTRWINKAQRVIAEKCPGLHSLTFKNTTSLDTTQSLQYAISDITVGDVSTIDRVCHLWNVAYLDGNESVQLTFIHTDDFDEERPDPTHSDYSPDKPTHWTRRGNYIEIYPVCACAYCDKDLRFDGGYYPGDLATNDVSASDISQADEGLIAFGVWKAWKAIGNETKSLIAKQEFVDWLGDYQDQNDILHEWDGNLYGDDIN